MIKKFENLLQKMITAKSLAVLLTILYVGTLIPLLMIAKYNVPSADDFSIGVTCRDAWLATHSVWQVLWQAILMAWNDFFHWMGYFSSIFMMAIHPGIFGESFYAATTWLMLGAVTIGTMYLMNAVLVKIFKVNPYISHSISMILLFVTVQCAVGRCEAYYWYCGAVNYTFFHGVSLLFYGLVISMFLDKNRVKRKFDMILACLLGFFVGGGNYMTSLNVCIIMIAALFLLVWNKKVKQYSLFFFPFGCFMTGFLLSCLAPGNSVRAADATAMNPIKAVFVSLYYCLEYCLSDWTGWVVLLLIIVCIPLFWKGFENTKFTFPCPILVVLFSYGVVSAMVTPPLFSLSNIEAGRLQALMYMMYILVLTIDVGYVTGWARYKWLLSHEMSILKQEKMPEVKTNTGFSINICWAIFVSAGFLVFGSILCVIPDTHYYTFTSAITDLANGNAKAYGETMQERFVILNDESIQDAVLPRLPAQPELLFYSDISEDAHYWENNSMAKGYHKNSVVLQKAE